MLRRTPCVGICSTTYGDLVCRGCKRFAHEIVQWNSFDQDQRRAVWERLLSLRAGAVAAVLALEDEARLREGARSLGLDGVDQLEPSNVIYEVLSRLQWRDGTWRLEDFGVCLLARDATEAPAGELDAGALLTAIDREFYRRSAAQYERNYRIPAQ